MKINGPDEIRKRAKRLTDEWVRACDRVSKPNENGILCHDSVPEGEVWFVKDGKVIGKITDIKESD